MDQKQHSNGGSRQQATPNVFRDFGDWFSTVLGDVRPSMVVAIARGAVRFLQLHCGGTLPPEIPFLSHDALPFLSDAAIRDARVLVFDDSVIYGSTMARVKEYLEARGAIVFCVANAVDRTTFLGEPQDPTGFPGTPSPHASIFVNARQKLWPASIRQHHGILVRSILQTPLHYNLDFPTIRLKVPTFRMGDGPFIAHLLQRTQSFEPIADVSSPLSLACGIARYSGMLRNEPYLGLCADGVTFRPYTKLRLTLVPSAGELRVTPVVQLAMRESVSHCNVRFASGRVQELWKLLVPPIHETDIFYHPALFRLLTTFAATLLGRDICGRVATALQQDFPVSTMSFLSEDVRLVLGEDNSLAIQAIWEEIHRQPIQEFSEPPQNQPVEVTERPNVPALRKAMLETMTRMPHLRPCDEELLCESVGKLFLTMREATDSRERRRANRTATRLDTGITFEGIRAVLQDGGRRAAEPREISLAVDMCIDRGLAVPKVVKEEGAWFRAFYCGEGEDDHDALQFKNGFYLAYGDFLKKQQKRKEILRLSPFDVQKLCVALKDLMPWLPVSTGPYKFGFTTTVGHEQLIDWLTLGPAAPCKIEAEGNRHVLAPNPTYLSPVKPVWGDGANEREFFDAFDYTATAFTKISDEAKLLLTTCRTHRHTFNAVAFEAHTWASYRENAFGGLLLAVEQALRNHDQVSRGSQQYLYWCIRYMSEALKKHRIFYRRNQGLLSEVKEAFCSQGPAGERWWTFVRRKDLFDFSQDVEIEHRFSLLLPLLAQMRLLTIFVGRLLEDSGLGTSDLLESVFSEHGTSSDWQEFRWFKAATRSKAAKAYNQNIDNAAVPGRSLLTSKLLAEDPKAGESKLEWAERSLAGARTCFEQVERALLEYCKKYKVAEGDFPFTPDRSRSLLDDGSVEERRDNIFLLTLDIIRGTNEAQTLTMKEEIRAVYRSFEHLGLVFEDTGNDAFVACCDDPLALWDAACSIRTRGDNLIVAGQAFGGTRKGLYFGSVAVIRKPNGATLIRDVRLPHFIPAAFSILDGIDKHVETAERNAVLIVEGKVAAGHCATRLRRDFKTLPQVMVKGKHFYGSCNIVKLQ